MPNWDGTTSKRNDGFVTFVKRFMKERESQKTRMSGSHGGKLHAEKSLSREN